MVDSGVLSTVGRTQILRKPQFLGVLSFWGIKHNKSVERSFRVQPPYQSILQNNNNENKKM